MPDRRRFLAPLAAFLLLLAPTVARADNPMAFVRANEWDQAALAAAREADPVAAKLVLFYRLLTPGAATPAEIAAFRAANPDWPDQGVLAHRYQEALAGDADPADLARRCLAGAATLPAAEAACATALAGTRPEAAAKAARRAYAAGLQDPDLARHWATAITPEDRWARFTVLLHADPAAAGALVPQLAPARRALAAAWLALRRGAPNAEALIRALPPAARHTRSLVLDRLRALRAAGDDAAALALWRKAGFAAERAGPPGPFWAERNVLARDLLQAGHAHAAYTLADDNDLTGSAAAASSGFLAGFIALTALHDPALAATAFHRVTAASGAAITQARGHYWLGRAAAASGADAAGEYRRAASYPTTFYGQLAAAALGENPAARLAALRDPPFTRAQAFTFTGHELVRAALLLVAWREPARARAFLFRMAEVAPDPAEQTLAARLSLALGLPESAVFIARRMGLEGRMLPDSGWPLAAAPPPPAPPLGAAQAAVVRSVIRQESSFDRRAVSPTGALGLMQLMPATAAAIARRIDLPITRVALRRDGARNVTLGTAYLSRLLDRFGGSLPLALAAYNAGPRRVDAWLAASGGPPRGASSTIDWIERIPFAETRNYVERVLEGTVIYLAHTGIAAPALTAQWTPGR
ncbi:MAG: lytic transglycosylase domain-containing protein [Rhodospirillales bacterium]|nr:lytic transglycosylase domain-containing protein [Rhodospirillales bacterium]